MCPSRPPRVGLSASKKYATVLGTWHRYDSVRNQGKVAGHHSQHVSILSCGSIVYQIEQKGAVAPSSLAESALDLQQQFTIQMLHTVAGYHYLSTNQRLSFLQRL